MQADTLLRSCRRPVLALAGLALSATATLALAGPIRSVGSVTFLDANTLAVADREGGDIHAITLPSAESSQPSPFNLKHVSAQIAKALHTSPENLRFEDMA